MTINNKKVGNTVKPDLTATCEQRPPVNNGQFESSTTSINLSFIRHLCQTATFFWSRGWPLYTGLTVFKLILFAFNSILFYHASSPFKQLWLSSKVSWFNVCNFFIDRTAVSWFFCKTVFIRRAVSWFMFITCFIRTVEVRTADPIQLSTWKRFSNFLWF